jgi:hypothetical protein
MFNSALSTTPPTLLDWPHVWILACIIFVFITLFFYVVILVKDKIRARSLILKIFPLGKGNQTNHQKLTWIHCILLYTFFLLGCSLWHISLFIFFNGLNSNTYMF